MHLSSRAIRLGTFYCKNCHKKSGFEKIFMLVAIFRILCYINFSVLFLSKPQKISLTLIQIKENRVLWLKRITNRFILVHPSAGSVSSKQ